MYYTKCKSQGGLYDTSEYYISTHHDDCYPKSDGNLGLNAASAFLSYDAYDFT